MIDHEVAALLDKLAVAVEQLPGVSRTQPHAFAEAKSELAGDMRRQAIELRTVLRASDRATAGAIHPGLRVLAGRRTVQVEVRLSRRA